MTVTTYAGLTASVADWLNRTDLTSQIVDFVTLVEAELNRDLSSREMFATVAGSLTTSNSYTLPSDFNGFRAIKLNTTPVTPLKFVKPDAFDDPNDAAYTSGGKPQFYTIIGSALVVSPTPDTTYSFTFTYRQTLPVLSTNSTNWVSTGHPDIYLYGCLMHAAEYLKDWDSFGQYKAKYDLAKASLASNDMTENYGQGLGMRFRKIGV